MNIQLFTMTVSRQVWKKIPSHPITMYIQKAANKSTCYLTLVLLWPDAADSILVSIGLQRTAFDRFQSTHQEQLDRTYWVIEYTLNRTWLVIQLPLAACKGRCCRTMRTRVHPLIMRITYSNHRWSEEKTHTIAKMAGSQSGATTGQPNYLYLKE
jgi:hypothetical protein